MLCSSATYRTLPSTCQNLVGPSTLDSSARLSNLGIYVNSWEFRKFDSQTVKSLVRMRLSWK